MSYLGYTVRENLSLKHKKTHMIQALQAAIRLNLAFIYVCYLILNNCLVMALKMH